MPHLSDMKQLPLVFDAMQYRIGSRTDFSHSENDLPFSANPS
jgi:hypothetical protein